MSKGRKTFDVLEFKNWINTQLQQDYNSVDCKMGLCSALERVLHDSNQYNGFMFLNINDRSHNSPGYWNRKYF